MTSGSSYFLHVGFRWDGPRPTIEALEAAFSNGKDWLRYAPDCWIVWTNSTPDVWLQRLRPLLKEKDQMLICKLDITTKQGWLMPWIWQWLNKQRAD